MKKSLVAMIVAVTAHSVPAWAQCELTVSGAVNASGKSKASAMELTTDYWFGPGELEPLLRAVEGGKTGPEVDAKIAKQLKADPVFATLIFNCMTDAATINFLPQGKYADVPFKPKKYVVAAREAKDGDVRVMIKVGNDMYVPAKPGVLDVTAFDTKRFAGTFEIEAKPMMDASGGPVTLKGKFDYGCVAPTKLCAASRGGK